MALLPKPFDFANLFELLSHIQVQSHVGVKKMARIVCSIGPANNSTKVLGKMIVAGMDVAPKSAPALCRVVFMERLQ